MQLFAHQTSHQHSDSSKTNTSSLVSITTLDNIYHGRLLYADDSLFVLWLSDTEFDLRNYHSASKVFKPNEITRLHFESESNALFDVWQGALIGYAVGFSFVMSIGSNQNYNPGIGSAPIPHDQLIRTSLMGGFPTAVLGGLINALINNFHSRELYITPKIYKSILSDLKNHALFRNEFPSDLLRIDTGK